MKEDSMDNSKKYSVIIRVRNEERWIGYAIQSIVDNIGEECEIIIVNNGSIEQVDTPAELYHSPNNPFIYNFLGHYNIFQATKDTAGKISILNKQSNSLIKNKKWYLPRAIQNIAA